SPATASTPEGGSIASPAAPRPGRSTAAILDLVTPQCRWPRCRADQDGLAKSRIKAEVHLLPGQPVQGRLVDPEVLRQQRPGGASDPVGDAEGAELREVTVVEDQYEVTRLVSEAFEHVTVAAREIPHVPRLEVVGLGLPVGLDDRRPDVPLVDERPLGRGGVPV